MIGAMRAATRPSRDRILDDLYGEGTAVRFHAMMVALTGTSIPPNTFL